MPAATIGDYDYRVSEDGTVTIHDLAPGGSLHRPRRREWRVMARAELLAYPVDGELWTWLRELGVRRPSPSGPRTPETRSEADRGGCRVRLDDAATTDADALAKRWGVGRPEAVARALREMSNG